MKYFLMFLIIFSCSKVPPKNDAKYLLSKDPFWYGDNINKLNTMLLHHGEKKPVAIFDWDNTVIKNDIGDAVFFWLLSHDDLRAPHDWKKSNPYLTDAAAIDLKKICGTGTTLKTTKNKVCADLLLSIYLEGKNLKGDKAWINFDPDLVEPAYLWAVQFMQGYSEQQIRTFALKAFTFNVNNPIGTKQYLGSKEYNAYLRIYEQQKNLINALQKNGFDVWVVTASAQNIVEAIAPLVGIYPDHVIGVRMMLDQKKHLTDQLQGCGKFSDGNREIMTYRKGKRCWINKIIYGLPDAKELIEKPSPSTFAAGDSDTDVFFVKDAKYHLVINRNKTEIMCHALANQDGNWMINPMFIDPKAKKKEAYDCSKYGLINQSE